MVANNMEYSGIQYAVKPETENEYGTPRNVSDVFDNVDIDKVRVKAEKSTSTLILRNKEGYVPFMGISVLMKIAADDVPGVVKELIEASDDGDQVKEAIVRFTDRMTMVNSTLRVER